MRLLDCRVGLIVATCGLATNLASGQVLHAEDFENGNPSNWQATGGSTLVGAGGNPGTYMGVPYGDWYWLTLSNDSEPTVIGDLSRHGGALTLGVDVQVTALNNWFNKPMDPSNFPLVFQFVDATDPQVSVYWTGPGMPNQTAGWVRFAVEIADPTSATLPAGWGGTGAEDPVTFEPVLPTGTTFADVMRNIGEVRITTAQPGYFYIPSFWEAGFDNIELSLSGGGGGCYANCDESTAAPVLNVADFTCFLQRFAAGEAYANCDESTAEPVLNVADFTCFLQSFAAGCK